MEAITRAEAVSYLEQAKRLKTTLLRNKQSTEEGISAAFTTGTAIVVGGGMAYLNERFGVSNADLGGALNEVVIPGTKAPADVVAGFVAHGAAFMGAFGKHAEHGHNIASALIGGWAVRNGMAMGKEAAASAGKTGTGWSPSTGRKERQAA
jgi:hypothetical protein